MNTHTKRVLSVYAVFYAVFYAVASIAQHKAEEQLQRDINFMLQTGHITLIPND